MRVATLTGTIKRRIGNLIITITAEGIELRGYHRRKRRKLVTWDQIASLADSMQPILAAVENESGRQALVEMAADPSAEPSAKKITRKPPVSPAECTVQKAGA